MHTMGSLDTMGLLGNSFIELAEHQPIEKISVSDIVAASGKNRKTFYYHFESKEHLIRWVFRRDLADVLKANVADDDLLFEPEGDDSFPSLPYYVHKKMGVRSLDGSVFFDMLAECFQYRRSYYAKTLRMSGPDSYRPTCTACTSPRWRRISASSCRTAICRRETSDSCRNSIRGRSCPISSIRCATPLARYNRRRQAVSEHRAFLA